jgi:hypothetical protein
MTYIENFYPVRGENRRENRKIRPKTTPTPWHLRRDTVARKNSGKSPQARNNYRRKVDARIDVAI